MQKKGTRKFEEYIQDFVKAKMMGTLLKSKSQDCRSFIEPLLNCHIE